MSRWKRILAAFLAAALTVPFAACGGDTETSDGGTEDSSQAVEGNVISGKYSDDWIIDQSKYEGKTLSIWTWWDLTESEKVKMGIETFEERTGATVDWQVLGWGDYPTQLVTAVSGGGGPDICFVGLENMPSYAINNIVLPVSDYIDYENPVITIFEGGKEAYTYKGKVYGLTDTESQCHKLYYRKSAFQNMGLEDPVDVFNRGEWTWDKFVEMGQQLTYDSDGNGEIDKYGYWAWSTFQWFSSNSARFIDFDEAGNPYFSMGEPNALESLQFLRDLDFANGSYKISAPWIMDHDPHTDFVAGRTAMDYWGDYILGDIENEGFRSQLGDDLGFVPCPIGPSYSGSNTTADVGDVLAICIGAGSDQPDLAALFMLLRRAPRNEEDETAKLEKSLETDLYKYGDQAGVDLAYLMSANAVFNQAGGYGKLGTIVDNILNDASVTPAQAVEANRAAAEAQIARTIEGTV